MSRSSITSTSTSIAHYASRPPRRGRRRHDRRGERSIEGTQGFSAGASAGAAQVQTSLFQMTNYK